VNPSPLCETAFDSSSLCGFVFEHQAESLFLENYLHRGIPFGSWLIPFPGSGLDANGLPLLTRLSNSAMDQVWFQVDPQRTVIDWRVGKVSKVSS
jgi:hypothetical protein